GVLCLRIRSRENGPLFGGPGSSSNRLFFFQAEDGIRGGHVTGVQTCALPIYRLLNELIAASLDRIKTRGYFAYVDGDAPAAWGFLGYLPDSPTFLLGGAATLEDHRGNVLYIALVSRPLADERPDARTSALNHAGW